VSSQGSITDWIDGTKLGDPEAARRIWERYSTRLSALARQRLPGCVRAVVDGEDLANSAFRYFLAGAQEGRFPDLIDRDGLWALLARITVWKANNEIKSAGRQKRPPPWAQVPLEDGVVPAVPPPVLEVMAAEQFQILIERLRVKDELLKSIAIWKFEGDTDQEIAQRLRCSRRRVARKLAMIRMILETEEPS
jgi:DNA-directed RNA polymerase specialized sigma24 family protein